MKNIALLICSIFIGLFFAEVGMRYLFLPWLGTGASEAPMIFLEHGYWVNPDSGTNREQRGKRVAYYHYYAPHLRDTKVNPRATPILVLGDSFTFGWLLPWHDTYVHHLQTNLDNTFGKNKYQLLNAAIGGWGTSDYLTYLEDYGSTLSPKYVLIFLNTDDIGRSIGKNMYELADAHSLQLTQHFHSIIRHPRLREFLINNWLIRHSALLQFVRYKFYALYADFFHIQFKSDYVFKPHEYVIPESTGLTFQDDFAIRYGEALFHRINQWCEQHHAKLLVVTTGFNAFYPKEMHDPTKTFLTKAHAFFSKENIPFDDIAPSFKQLVQGKVIQIPNDLHPNELGDQAIAEVSWPWIKQQIELG